jgi:hypothetical protein
MIVHGSLTAFINLIAQKTVEGDVVGTFPVPISKSQTFAYGRGAEQMDELLMSRDNAISASSTESFDVVSGLTNVMGEAVVMTRIKGLYLANISGNGAALRLAVTNADIFDDPTTAILIVPDGGVCAWSAPVAVGPGSITGAAEVRISNPGGNDGIYDLVIFGRKV